MGGGRRCIVVGGGISGLAAAHRLLEMAPAGGPPWSVTLLEADGRLGGLIRTERVGEYLFDDGPDTLIAQKPAAARLAARLGLAGELVPIGARRCSTEVVHRGRLVPVPEGFVMLAPSRLWPVVSSPLFSIRGKLRMFREPWIAAPPEPPEDESLASFVERRLGREVLERVAEPVVAGLFLARAEDLSLAMTMPRFLELERREGSMIRGLRRAMRRPPQEGRRERDGRSADHDPAGRVGPLARDGGSGGAPRSAARPGGPAPAPFLALRGGLGRFVDEIRRHLPPGTVRTGAKVRRLALERRRDTWHYETETGETGSGDAVLLACPAPAMSLILENVDPVLADRLLALEYASCATVTLAYDTSALGRRLTSYGFFVPRGSEVPLIACSYLSEKFVGRAPAGVAVLRAFFGGPHRQAPLEESDERLARTAHEALARLLNLKGEPVLARVNRFPGSMPQYAVGCGRRIAWLERRALEHPGLFLAGSAVGARGLPDCIQSGEAAAERVAARFLERPEPLAISIGPEGPARNLSGAGRTHDVPSRRA
jgi:oxygen-dependent protoporphyrinogen oxidase